MQGEEEPPQRPDEAASGQSGAAAADGVTRRSSLGAIALGALLPGGSALSAQAAERPGTAPSQLFVSDPAVNAAYVAANPDAAIVDASGRGFRRLESDDLRVRNGPRGPLIRIEDAFEFGARLTRYGFVGDGRRDGRGRWAGTDDSKAWRDAIEEAGERNISKIIVPWGATGTSIVERPIVDGKLPAGLSFEGEGARDSTEYTPGTRLLYTGSGTCWKILFEGDPLEVGRWTWRNLAFWTTNPAATMFDINDPTVNDSKDDGNPSYVSGIGFANCFFMGPDGGAAQTGDAFRGLKLYNLHLDKRTYIRGFRYGVWLKGCDDCTVEARIYLCGQNVRFESSSHGNNNQLRSNWLGPCSATASVARYLLWDDTGGLACHGTAFEAATGEAACLYLNGWSTSLIGNRFAGAPIFRLGPNAKEIVMISPNIGVHNEDWAPVIDPPVSWDFGFGQEDYRMMIIGATKNIARTLGSHPRLLYRDRFPQAHDGAAQVPAAQDTEMLADARGVRPRRHLLSPLNWFAKTTGTIVNGGATAVRDRDASGGWSFFLDNRIDAAGLNVEFRIGIDFAVGDLVRVAVRAKSAAQTGWAVWALRNHKFHSAPVAAVQGPRYALFTGTVDLTGWAVGDVLSIAVLNANRAAAPAQVDYAEFASVAAVEAPSGGQTVDREARAALAALVAALQARGDLA